MFKNKVVQENKDLQEAEKRLQEKRAKEIEEYYNKIRNMNRHDRRAFAKVNKLPPIPGVDTHKK